MKQTFDRTDEGKPVVTPDGELVGWVARAEGGRPKIRPRPDLVSGYGSWITGTWDDAGPFDLDPERIDHVTDRNVVLAPGGTESAGGTRSRPSE